MGTVYDQVRYPNWPVARSHPGHVGAIARLLGREIAPLKNCRVLEIGCSEGANIANMAIGAPNSEFIGLDLAASAIGRGKKIVALAGLGNVELKVADLRDKATAPGLFDYIVVHGVYSWIADDARAALVALIGEKLSPRGVAFLSYNCFPGCRTRQTIRDFLRFTMRGYDDPAQRLAIAREALEFQIDAWDSDDPAQKALIEAAKGNLTRPLEVLFHDEMGEDWAPQFLFDVVEAARAQGLDYLADAHPEDLADALFPSPRFEAALPRTGGDWAKFCQFQDFISLRAFRWSLFCRAGTPPPRVATPDRLAGLYASGDFSPAPGEGKKAYAFRGKRGVEFETDDERLGGMFARLAAGEAVLLDDCAGDADLAESLLRLYVGDTLTLSTEPPLFSREIGERPCASPLARAQSQMGDVVLASLHHRPVRMEDPFWTQFLPQVDGTRTRPELARFVAEATGKDFEDAHGLITGALKEVSANRLMLQRPRAASHV